MAFSCAHCRSADVAPLFRSYQCFTCGKHTTDDGRPILPDSLTFEPNHDPATAQFGWPFEDQQPTLDRGLEVCSTQWGTPIAGVPSSHE